MASGTLLENNQLHSKNRGSRSIKLFTRRLTRPVRLFLLVFPSGLDTALNINIFWIYRHAVERKSEYSKICLNQTDPRL